MMTCQTRLLTLQDCSFAAILRAEVVPKKVSAASVLERLQQEQEQQEKQRQQEEEQQKKEQQDDEAEEEQAEEDQDS
jgi:mannitol-specific phosphotransferase system IIBC component